MKIRLLLSIITCLLLFGSLTAQNTYHRNYGTQGSDVHYLINTSDGGTLIGSYGGGILLIKLDCYGEEEWSKQISSSAFSLICKGIAQTTDGGYVTCAYYSDNSYQKMGVIRLDANGDFLWSNKYYYSSSNSAWDMIAGPDGSVLLTGGGCSGDNYLMKIDANGNMEWQKQYRTTDFGGTGMNFHRAANGDLLILISHYQFSTTNRDMAVIRLDPEGDLIWFNRYGTDKTEYIEAITEDSDGNILFTCNSDVASIDGYRDIILTKVDADGNYLWSKIYDNSTGDHGYGIVENSDGKYSLTGSRFDSVDNVQIVLAQIDKNGNWEWSKSFGGWAYDGAKGIMATSTGQLKIFGGNSGLFVAQVENDGTGLCSSADDVFTQNDIVLNVLEMTASTTTASLAFITDTLGVTILSNVVTSTLDCGAIPTSCAATVQEELPHVNITPYPNPFSYATTFEIPVELKDAVSEVKLHDIYGKEIKRYSVDQGLVTIQRDDLSSGIYFYSLKAKSNTYSGKLVIE